MTIDTLLMLAGAFVAALPFSGFPHSWQKVLFFLAGVCVIALGVVVRRRRGSRESAVSGFEEHDPSRVSRNPHAQE